MSAYSGTSKRVKNALVLLLQGITYDTGDGAQTAFAAVLDNTTGDDHSDQLAQVLPGDFTDQRETSAQNDRVLNYVVRVRLDLEETPESESNTYDRMYDLTDLVIDELDKADGLTLADTIGAIPILTLDISRGDWSVVDSNGGAKLFCDLNVAITYSRTVR